MSITYALIAEGIIKSTMDNSVNISVIAETSCQKTLRMVIEQKVIPKMVNKENMSNYDKLILTHEMFNFFIKRERSSLGDLFYVVISTQDGKQRICWNMIESMSTEYHQHKKQVNLTKLMQFHNDTNNDKISKLQNAVDEVKNVMIINIDKILDNQKKMHELIVETDSLREQAEIFQRGGRKLKWAMAKRWIYISAAVVVTGLVIIGVIALILALAL
ncbi:synaptobrevin/VAMP protein [Naegleria gruberi]|uniref:Synaptobrevin/VAMP protein n=1 Tax=Naegleria gruberi TaxID=5762 RepID=D2V413_NAEGR|nr:synaptobrevin/VAMP protein [Naegleria gruberi]EFC48444.1 synaptobrevin/VAMP protein [Naegleria gruberi]|eukprot:XP_002681188.1 synaptobrevin/VAMP protein [Naegleria gruberi strain NEG-M]